MNKHARPQTVTTDVEDADSEPALPEPELQPHLWMPDNLPLFIITKFEDIERIVANGMGMFYVTALTSDRVEEAHQYSAPTVKHINHRPQIFKVINNLIARTITAADSDVIGLPDLTHKTNMCWFQLPKIPYDLIDKMDSFFRRVARDLGTEAILMLTYDRRKLHTPDAMLGWGVVVPTQENNAGHCKYEPNSIVEQIPDEDEAFVSVVGTAHSHPEMSAFASHTDHEDQADFDGLHITFGWPKNGPTQHHIEMQVQKKTYTYKEDIIFGDRPKETEFPELEEWSKQVKKEVIVPKAVTSYRGTSSTPGSSDRKWDQEHWDEEGLYWSPKTRSLTFPKGVPSPLDNVLIVNLFNGEKKCPICYQWILDQDLNQRCCGACYTYWLCDEESIEQMLTRRKEAGKPMGRLGNSAKPIKLITRTKAATASAPAKVDIEVLDLSEEVKKG